MLCNFDRKFSENSPEIPRIFLKLPMWNYSSSNFILIFQKFAPVSIISQTYPFISIIFFFFFSEIVNLFPSVLSNCSRIDILPSLIVTNNKAGFKQLWFPVTASSSAAGIPLVYINNLIIQIWCSMPFYSMLCGSNLCRMYLQPHGPLFESSGRKYIWTILLHSNTNNSHSGFYRADCNLRQRRLQCATWCECISTVCRWRFMVCHHGKPQSLKTSLNHNVL